MQYKDKDCKIVFLDHVEDGDKPLECVVWGKIIDVCRRFFTVVSWDIIADNEESVKINRKTFTILRSTIVEMYIVEKYKTIKSKKIQ
jgi:hypothetical protein